MHASAERPVSAEEMVPELKGSEVSIFSIDDLRTTNLHAPGTDFALGVGAVGLRLSHGSTSQEDTVLNVAPGLDNLRFTAQRGTSLFADTGDASAVNMVNEWLAEGEHRVIDVHLSGSDIRFVFSDSRFLAICGSVDTVGVMAGQSVENYNVTTGAVEL